MNVAIELRPSIICPTCGELNLIPPSVQETLEHGQGPTGILCGACEEPAPRDDWELVE
jgi:hypothetical protein